MEFAFINVHSLSPQDSAEVATLIELKVLSDLFIPPVPSNSAQGNTLYVVGATYSVPVNIDKIQGSVFVQKTLFFESCILC